MGTSITKGWYYDSDAGLHQYGVYNASGTIVPVFDENGSLYNAGASLGSTYYKTYYVDSNGGADTNDGLSWATAFKKLSVALAASHASIAAASTGWAARNRIFFKGDQTKTTEGENLTALAQKTDIIGVGSTDWKAKPQLIGNHAVTNTVSYMGCRFINVMFKGPTAKGGDIFAITGQHGIAFIGCEFMGDSTTAATGAIISTGGVNLQVINCVFKGAFTDAVIEIGEGQADDLVIVGNLIQGANMGVDISGSATFADGKYGLIKDNVMSTGLACINDGEKKSYVIGNRLITAAAKGTQMAGCIVCNDALAQDNRCSTSNANNVEYPALGEI
jgi:hypothetical protein